MNLAQLIDAYRVAADDRVTPGELFDDEQVARWLSEAQDEAALRRRLIYDATTADVCVVNVSIGNSVFPKHPKVFEISWAAFVPTADPEHITPLHLMSREALTAEDPKWRTRLGEPRVLIHDDTTLQVCPKPIEAGSLQLEVYRLPMDPLELDDDEPEIHEAHHMYLVDWALFRAFSVPDSEFIDAKRAVEAEARFTAYFGPRPDADLRRDVTADVPHHNVSYF